MQDHSPPSRLGARVGAALRSAREQAGLSRNRLAEASGVSLRYLAQIETGQGNMSLAVLEKVCAALNTPISTLFSVDAEEEMVARLWRAASAEQQAAALVALRGADTGHACRIALTGLRGAGKSTLGRRVADQFGVPFLELNGEIEAESGMLVADLIALYGQEGYRRLEASAVDRIAAAHDRVILAVAGGIVSEAQTYETLLARFHTIWLKAAPEEHMSRVRAQGDDRPMAGNPAAMDALREILKSREALYGRAPYLLDTSGSDETRSSEALAALIAREGLLG